MKSSLSITDQLLANADRRDEQANIELAASIVRRRDAGAVSEVFANFGTKKLQSDCIKVVSEIGAREPALIAPYAEHLFELLEYKNNRIVWGAMTALDTITPLRSEAVYQRLDRLSAIAKAGSVITRDHFVNILIELAHKKADVIPLLSEQFADCPPNQLPMYAERALPLLRQIDNREFLDILCRRLPEMNTESKRKRVQKVVKQLVKTGCDE